MCEHSGEGQGRISDARWAIRAGASDELSSACILKREECFEREPEQAPREHSEQYRAAGRAKGRRRHYDGGEWKGWRQERGNEERFASMFAELRLEPLRCRRFDEVR